MRSPLAAIAIAGFAVCSIQVASAQTMPAGSPAASVAPSASAAPLPSPDAALTQRLAGFFQDMIAGKPPTQNLTSIMQAAMTPSALAPVKQFFAGLGTFEQLQFISHDQLGGYQRYHFLATFSSGSQKVMFVLDPTGALAGFFNE
jgi:hypothetical protein